jgi:VCBS repeat-containing protein
MLRFFVPALLAALVLVVSPGCQLLENALSPVAAEGLLVSITAPDDGDLPDVDIQIESEVGATVFLAEAEVVATIEGSPLLGAEVGLSGPFGSVNLVEEGNGTYQITSAQAEVMSYQAGGTYIMDVDAGDGVRRSVTVTAPTPSGIVWPAVDEPQSLAEFAANGWTIDLGRSYDNALAVLVAEDGEIVFDNRPTSVRDYLDWILATGVDAITIPAAAFQGLAPGAYGVGVAPLNRASDEDFQDLNPLVSNALVGGMEMSVVLFE